MLVLVILTMASLGSLIVGSGTCSTRTSRLPCQVTAFIRVHRFLLSLGEPGAARDAAGETQRRRITASRRHPAAWLAAGRRWRPDPAPRPGPRGTRRTWCWQKRPAAPPPRPPARRGPPALP